MVHSFQLQNFRCFETLSFTKLSRFNLITGKNNSGKTAFLEALFLWLGPANPQLSLALNNFRGVDSVTLDPDQMWGWLFRARDVKKTITLTGNLDGAQRALEISLSKRDVLPVGTTANGSAVQGEGLVLSTEARTAEFVAKYKDDSGYEGESRVYLTSKGLEQKVADLPEMPRGIFVHSHATRGHAEDTVRFTRTQDAGFEESLVADLRIMEPRLRRVLVGSTEAGPQLRGDLGGNLHVPFPYMGDGLVRLTKILLSIYEAKGGVVLIDEIENGLHHSVQQDVWRILLRTASTMNVQVFSTSHSWEMISAAEEVFGKLDKSEFKLIRLEQIRNELHAVEYDSATLEAAIEGGFEVR